MNNSTAPIIVAAVAAVVVIAVLPIESNLAPQNHRLPRQQRRDATKLMQRARG